MIHSKKEQQYWDDTCLLCDKEPLTSDEITNDIVKLPLYNAKLDWEDDCYRHFKFSKKACFSWVHANCLARLGKLLTKEKIDE